MVDALALASTPFNYAETRRLEGLPQNADRGQQLVELVDDQPWDEKALVNSVYDTYRVCEQEAWNQVLYAQKLGPHRWMALRTQPLRERVEVLSSAASPGDWYILLVSLTVVILVDYFILQQLPDNERTHIVILLFWLLAGVTFSVEIWSWPRIGCVVAHWLRAGGRIFFG